MDDFNQGQNQNQMPGAPTDLPVVKPTAVEPVEPTVESVEAPMEPPVMPTMPTDDTTVVPPVTDQPAV